MICSALQWLVDRKKLGSFGKNGKENFGEVTGDDDEPDWMRNFVPRKELDLAERKNLMQKKEKGTRSKGKEEIVRDLFSKYDSEGENGGKLKRKDVGADDVFSSEEDVEEEGLGEEEVEAQLKIYFCSRTHSQLSQFMKELRKTKFASELKVVCLGSRKNFCINEGQRHHNQGTTFFSHTGKLGAGKRVRDNKASSGCPMLRRRKIKELRNELIQLEALDIEDLVHIGRNLGSCPYYGSRRMDSVIIIDEAHNLADTLISIRCKNYGVPVEPVAGSLGWIFRRFCSLLGPGNRRYIQTLIILTRAFLQMLSDDMNVVNPTDPSCDADEIKNASCSTMTINEFLFGLNIDNINLVKLLQYMTESNIITLVSGYGDKVAISQKVMLLEMMVVDQAHAVILAGGTLQPIEETKERLFPSLQLDRLPFFSCGHIIPSENILPVVVKHGPSGRSFDFSYKSRRSSTMASGILLRIIKKKRIFREPRKTTDVEAVLREYKETIDALSMGRCIVMVGLPYPSPSDIELIERVKHIEGLEKTTILSKNLNSSSNAECHNGDLEAGFQILKSCKGRGKEYYENLCMKAVNQSIGRAIRHVNDYAAILLVDARYASDSTKRSCPHSTDKLPQWIKSRLVTSTTNYGEVHRLLRQFFKSHKTKEATDKDFNNK
ncbi:UNVERIFIED_CONTAM: ATP-dependent DNA helicase DDX11 [Sesamum calycinum]|uniref:ATP-dependent DNA helicase DDX11 n=1 Tax=Sesamum calycinum TaxID=2727403 RepID=A0AAW2NHT8_9LAMI